MQTQLTDSAGNPVACEAIAPPDKPEKPKRKAKESPPETSQTGAVGGAATAEPPDSNVPGAAAPPAPGLIVCTMTEGK